MNQDTSSPTQPQQRPARSPAEWTAFSLALAILAVVIGLVLYDWFTSKEQPPSLEIVQDTSAIYPAQGKFYVPFTVTNTGGDTAESVQVLAELRIKGEVEEGEQQIDFLAGDETEAGAFVFSRDPRQGELILRAASYKLP